MNVTIKQFFMWAMVLTPSLLFAQVDLNQKMPIDPEVRMGKLSNGMTYYIRHNQEPKERASFYMIQNVGALLEEDNQNGLAHFLEHMAFNGTQHFEGKGIINFLEKNGVAFGRNINAGTGFDETVYNLSEVPTNKPGLVDSCLLVLNDWSDFLLLKNEEVDAERGVITEEWRTRRNASFRLRQLFFPVLLKGSKYEIRDVIGDLNVIKNFDYQTLRDFYVKWYRTDLQAIAIVGDINVDEVEAKVKELFSKIAPVENAPERYYTKVPEHVEDYYVLATDKEAAQSSISIYSLMPNKDRQDKTVGDVREGLIRSFYNSMFSQRIAELLQKGTPPFVAGGCMIGGFLKGYDVYSITATANPNKEDIALESILSENERVNRFGFAESELQRAKTNYLTNLESAYKQKDKINNDRYCDKYSEHYLNNDEISSFDYSYELTKKLIPTITAQEISAKAKEWIANKNRTVIITGPSEGIKHLTESEVKAIMEKVKYAKIEPYVDAVSASSLISDNLKGSKIVSTKKLEALNAEEWTLANGVKVVYRLADYEKDQVNIQAFSNGVSSLFGNDYIESTMMFANLIGSYGVGDFDAMTLRKMLTGKKVTVGPNIGELTEGINGSTTPNDFETMLQLFYLYFEKPRFDADAHGAMLARIKAYMANMANNPQKIMGDSLNLILSNYNSRTKIINDPFFDKVDLKKIEEMYRDRMKDASDFTFILVGNIPAETAKPMVEKYLGSLTDINRKETWKDLDINMPKGKTVKDIKLALEVKKATVNVIYSNEMKYSAFNSLSIKMLQEILDLRFTEEIREKESGTYSVSVRGNIAQYPKSEANIQIAFDCDPNRAAFLKEIVYKIINRMIVEGPTQIDLDKTLENMRKTRESAKNHNNYWMSTLYNYYYNGIDNNDPKNFDQILNKITTSDIQKVAKTFFGTADVADVVFSPKE